MYVSTDTKPSSVKGQAKEITGEFHRHMLMLCEEYNIRTSIKIRALPDSTPLPNIFPHSRESSNVESEESFEIPPQVRVSGENEDIPTRHSQDPEKTHMFLGLNSPEGFDSATRIIIKDLELDDRMINVLRRSIFYLEKLHSVTLWNVGIKTVTMPLLVAWLRNVPNLKSFSLDFNPIPDENFHLLLQEPLALKTASFRFCGITDFGASLIGQALGSVTRCNASLLTLNLMGNKIRDDGATALALGLRLNDTLVSLCLAGNQIGDKGAKAIAEMLMPSQLTPDELQQRRTYLFRKTETDPILKKKPAQISPRFTELLMVDKPDQKRSRMNIDGTKKQKPTSKQTKDTAVTGKTPGVLEVVKSGVICDKKQTTDDIETFVSSGHNTAECVLLYKVKQQTDHTTILCGNFILLSINLARNKIGSKGMEALAQSLMYQRNSQCKSQSTGLMRLVLTGNKVDPTDPTYVQLTNMMDNSDPLFSYVQNLVELAQKADDERSARLEELDQHGLFSPTSISSRMQKHST